MPLRARYHRRGPVPHDLVEVEAFEPPPLAAGEALVEVLAAPINPADLMTLTGQYGALPPLPATGGNEGVGRVQALGPGTDGPPVGQVVLLPTGLGSWSTNVVAPVADLLPLPDGDPLQLAMLTVNPPTARLLLTEIVPLHPGDWVIQNAANSGVGGYLVQLAKARGLRTVNVVRRASAIADVESLGADIVLVDGDDLAARVADATGNAAIRLGVDAVGGAATERIASCVARGGTVVNYGTVGGEPCTISTASLVFRDVTLRGFWRTEWFRTADPAVVRALLLELADLVAAGAMHARVQATFPLEAVREAVELAASRGRSGKVLLVPSLSPGG